MQAAKWVKNMEKDNKLVVIKYSDPNYIGLIQNAVSVFLSFCTYHRPHHHHHYHHYYIMTNHQVQFGLPCLLENVDENLDPGLGPILLKQVIIIIMMESDFMS